MTEASAPAAILLHGLPFRDQPNPLDQLTALRTIVEAFISPANITPYEWLADLVPPVPRTATVRALRGHLGVAIAQAGKFAQTMAQLLAVHERVAVLGYSAGGWIFYDWLATAPPEQRQHISVAILLGAPYQNVRDDLYFGDATEPARTQRWQYLSADTLAHALAPGRLYTMLSNADRTVWPENARFLDTYYTQGLMRERVLSQVDHRQLLTHPDVLRHIRAALLAVLS